MPRSLKISALLCIGLAIVFYYFFQTTKHAPELAMVAAIFIGVESAGVLLGYALFAKPLGLFRQASSP